MHLYALNRGVLLTPFHNMALMSPATTEADVDRHTEVFAEAARELTGLTEDDAARVPGARAEVERAARLAEQRQKHAAPDRVLLFGGGCPAQVDAGGPDRDVNGSQKSSESS